MSDWITLNIGFTPLNKNQINKILKEEYKIHKPSIPKLENEALKKLGINKKSLFNFLIKNNFDQLTYEKSIRDYQVDKVKKAIKNKSKKDLINIFTDPQSCKGNGIYISYNSDLFYYKEFEHYINNFESLKEFIKNYNIYNNFINLHLKTQNYLIKNKEYLDLFEKVNKEKCFETSEYNKPGYLINCEDKSTGQIYSFLIGHYSDFRYNTENLNVIRVKKVLTDEEISGIHLFD